MLCKQKSNFCEMTLKEKALVGYVGLATGIFTAYAINHTVHYFLNRPYYCPSCGKPVGRDGALTPTPIQKQPSDKWTVSSCLP